MIGAGAWGIAMARSLAEAHPNVCLYARNAETVAEMTETRQHAAYLPGVLLPNQV
ncbi:NAD(P)-binding domain-containing protein, partial [Negativicoccus succinicivorans]